MYNRDYILKMIEMVEQLIAAITSKIRKGETGKASEQLAGIYKDVFKDEAWNFRKMELSDINRMLSEHQYTNGHWEILAQLFCADAELSEVNGDKAQAIHYLTNSLIIYEYIDNDTRTYSLERINKMESIRKRIDSNT